MSFQNFPCKNCCFLSVLEKITDGFILVDQNGNILMMNPAARRLLGIGREAINGQPLNRYLVDLQLKRFWQETANANADMVTEDIHISKPFECNLKASAFMHRCSRGPLVKALLLENTTEEVEVTLRMEKSAAQQLLSLAEANASVIALRIDHPPPQILPKEKSKCSDCLDMVWITNQ